MKKKSTKNSFINFPIVIFAIISFFVCSCASTPKDETPENFSAPIVTENEKTEIGTHETESAKTESAQAKQNENDEAADYGNAESDKGTAALDTDYTDIDDGIGIKKAETLETDATEEIAENLPPPMLQEPLVRDIPFPVATVSETPANNTTDTNTVEKKQEMQEPLVRDAPPAAPPIDVPQQKDVQLHEPDETPDVEIAQATEPSTVTTSSIPENTQFESTLPKIENTTDNTTAPRMSYEQTTENTSEPPRTQKKAQQENVSPSRSVAIDMGAYLDIEYPGNGWVYLGEKDDTDLMLFFGRKISETETSFTMKARRSGTTLLHFYKNDLLTGNYIDDYLKVVISDKPVENNAIHTVAPSYAEAVPPRPVIQTPEENNVNYVQVPDTAPRQTNSTVTQPQETARDSYVHTPQNSAPTPTTENQVSQTSESTNSGDARTAIQRNENSTGNIIDAAPSPEIAMRNSNDEVSNSAPLVISRDDERQNLQPANDILENAKSLYAKAEYENALSAIHNFFDVATEKIDEGLFLQGQILEAPSNVRNIRAALDSYEILMNNWPESAYWQDAERRSIYLKRFYINIR